MYYHVATDVKRCVLRGGKDDDFYDQSKTKKSGRGGSRTYVRANVTYVRADYVTYVRADYVTYVRANVT